MNAPYLYMDKHGRKSDEEFFPYHSENEPGRRVIDMYSAHIIRETKGMPKKSSDKFDGWLKENFIPRLESRQESLDYVSSSQMAVTKIVLYHRLFSFYLIS